MFNSNKIQFIYTFSNSRDYHYILHNDVNTYDFSKGFNERLSKTTEYIRIYIDCDHISNINEYNQFISYCNSIKNTLGEYSIGGYTNDIDISNQIGLKYIKNADKIISIHIVFYQVRTKPSVLNDFIKQNKDKLDTQIDTNVYKLSTSQLFRHCMSDKRISASNIKQTAGNILNGLSPSTQIITADGSEQEIDNETLMKAFGLEDEMEGYDIFDGDIIDTDMIVDMLDVSNDLANNPVNLLETKVCKQKSTKKDICKFTINDIGYSNDLIQLDRFELLELLNNITQEPHNSDLIHTITQLYHSPLDIDFIIDVVSEWYEQIDHKTDDNINQIVHSMYKSENSNKWLFSLINKIGNEEIKQEWKAKYKTQSVNMEVTINNSTWCYTDIIRKDYNINDLTSLLTDLRGIIGFVGSRYFIKEYVPNSKQYYVHEYKKETFNDMLTKRKPFKGNNKINLCQIVNEYSNLFLYDDYQLYKPDNTNIDKQLHTINIFQGYKYDEIITDDFTILEPFLKHIKEVNCNNNDKKYEYLMNWFANIIKNIAVKNGTMPIMYGSQGSGKSMFVETMCELLGHLAVSNADDLDKVFGKFNKMNENKVLIVLNEISEATDKFAYSEKMKSRITQTNTLIESKGVDTRIGLNYANYIMTANYPDPIVSQKGDRRSIYFPTNNKYCGDMDYFTELFKDIQPKKQGEYNQKFMGILLHYMLTQFDPDSFNFEKLIIETNNNTKTIYNEQLERQYEGLDGVNKFVVDRYQWFEIGFPIDKICIEGYKTTGIAKKLKSICDEPVRLRINSKKAKELQDKYISIDDVTPNVYSEFETTQTRFYKLKSREQIPDLYNIIDYKKFQAEQANNNDDE